MTLSESKKAYSSTTKKVVRTRVINHVMLNLPESDQKDFLRWQKNLEANPGKSYWVLAAKKVGLSDTLSTMCVVREYRNGSCDYAFDGTSEPGSYAECMEKYNETI